MEPFKGALIEELPPFHQNVKFARPYMKALPFLFLLPFIIMLVMWWAIDLPMDSLPLWTSLLVMIVSVPIVYLIVEKALVTSLYPVSFYSNGIELRISRIDRLRKIPNFIERSMMDSIDFLEFEYNNEGAYRHETKIEIKLKSGRSIDMGHPKNEVAIKIKGLVEKNYSVRSVWKKFQLNQQQQKALDKVRPKAQQAFCIHCGARTESGNDFCTSCGGKQS